MDNEILDVTSQRNFDFFQYRYELTSERKEKFLKSCQNVLQTAHSAVLGMLRLGVELKKMKDSGEWCSVINPDTNERFLYSSFEAFSKYAFGFGKTKTSNLLSLAQFVDLDERTGVVVYKKALYKEMNTSQLVELAPLSTWQHEYFSPDLSVAEIRVCKRYMNSGQFWNDKSKDGFDLLTCATRWTENLNKQKEKEEERKVIEEVAKAADEADDVEYFDGFSVPTTERSDEERQQIEELRARAHEAGVPFSDKYADEDFDPYVFDGSMTVEDYELMHKHIEEGTQRSDNGTDETSKDDCKYSFSSRTRARAFLADYARWELRETSSFFDRVYRFAFKNGMALFAATCKTCVAAAELNEKETLFFFLHVRSDKQPIKMAKSKLEIWLKANESDLIGGV